MQHEEELRQDMPRKGGATGIAVRLVYPLIDALFSEKYAQRMKIAMNVIGSDWRMPSPYTFMPDPKERAYSYGEFMSMFNDMDECSRECAEKFFYCSQQMPHIAHDAERLFFYNYSYFKPAWIKSDKARRHMKRDCAGFRKQFGLECGAEAAHYHHGLRLMDKSVHEYISGRAFIDVGACNGDSTVAMDNYSPSKIYAFEPSASNRKEYCGNMERIGIAPDRYELLPFGLGELDTTIYFNDKGGGSNNLIDGGDDICQIMRLDTFCDGRAIDVGLVKIDIEGMGEPMIRGSLGTIERCRPVLCLAIYHHASELCETTRLLRSRLHGYSFALRGLGQFDTCHETTLIAWPSEVFDGNIAEEC